jgi:hypothetical protein
MLHPLCLVPRFTDKKTDFHQSYLFKTNLKERVKNII